jgi:hypothetical protein
MAPGWHDSLSMCVRMAYGMGVAPTHGQSRTCLHSYRAIMRVGYQYRAIMRVGYQYRLRIFFSSRWRSWANQPTSACSYDGWSQPHRT